MRRTATKIKFIPEQEMQLPNELQLLDSHNSLYESCHKLREIERRKRKMGFYDREEQVPFKGCVIFRFNIQMPSLRHELLHTIILRKIAMEGKACKRSNPSSKPIKGQDPINVSTPSQNLTND
jgi:hypothetical protein